MQADTIKLFFTYIIATIIIVGGGLFLYATRTEESGRELQLLVGGFIGAAIAYVFNRETATQATRAAQSTFTQASNTNPPPEQ